MFNPSRVDSLQSYIDSIEYWFNDVDYIPPIQPDPKRLLGFAYMESQRPYSLAG